MPAWKEIRDVPVEYNRPGKPDHPDVPYEGDKPYIFISYAFRDEKKVFKIIRDMQDRGLRIWYERSSGNLLGAGPEESYHIEERIRSCSYAIMFSTDYWLQAMRCRAEFDFADREGKPCLIVLTSNDLNWDTAQRLYQHTVIETENFDQESDFYSKLYDVQEIRDLLASSNSQHSNHSRSSGGSLFKRIISSILGEDQRK